MKKMQRRGKLDKDGSKKGSKESKGSSGDGSTKGGSNGGGKGGGKENFEGTESVASHEDGFVDSDEDDELVFDPLDDVATSDETSEAGSSANLQMAPHHPTPSHSVGSGADGALDLRGVPMPPIHNPMAMSHSSMHHHPYPGNLPHNPVPGGIPPQMPSLENLQNPIDKLYLMQDSYFTQMWKKTTIPFIII